MITRALSGFLMGVMLCTPVSAQYKEDVRAPVNVAIRLYTDCMETKSQTVRIDHVKTLEDAHDLGEEVDNWCIAWTVIWYNAVHSMPIDTWDETRLNRFTAVRYNTLRNWVTSLALARGLATR